MMNNKTYTNMLLRRLQEKQDAINACIKELQDDKLTDNEKITLALDHLITFNKG